jgi:hypothetical protein
MSPKSRRRRGSGQEHHDAATEQGNISTRPSQDEAFAAFCTLLAYAVGQGAPAVYTQNNRPVDCKSRDAFARWHRAARRAAIPGVWVKGKLLCATPEAWGAPLPKAQPPLSLVEAPRDVGAEIDAAFGVRTRVPQ